MENLKKQILDIFNFTLKRKVEKTLLVDTSGEENYINGIPRLIVNLKGISRTTFFMDGKLETVDFPENTWFYCSANGHLLHPPMYANECISICYYGDYMRTMHITYDGIIPPPTERDIYYHTDHGISHAGQQIISTLDELASSSEYVDAAPYLLKALLKISIKDIEKSYNDPAKFNANSKWVAINTYLHTHCKEPISRKSVARYFNVSPGHISNLFHNFSQTNFSNTLLNLRLQHASEMLVKTYLSIDEISFESGFNDTSYFIRRFKKHYGITPHAYRKTHRKNA